MRQWQEHSMEETSSPSWLTAPTTISPDVVPLGLLVEAPKNPRSPTRGSAVSRARWSTTVPSVHSVRHSRKMSLPADPSSRRLHERSHTGTTQSSSLPQSPRTNGTAPSTSLDSDDDKEPSRLPPVVRSSSRTRGASPTPHESRNERNESRTRGSSSTRPRETRDERKRSSTRGSTGATQMETRDERKRSSSRTRGSSNTTQLETRDERKRSSSRARSGTTQMETRDEQEVRTRFAFRESPPLVTDTDVTTARDHGWTSATLPPSSPRPTSGTNRSSKRVAALPVEVVTTQVCDPKVLAAAQNAPKESQPLVVVTIGKKKSSRREHRPPPTDQIVVEQKQRHRGRSVSRHVPSSPLSPPLHHPTTMAQRDRSHSSPHRQPLVQQRSSSQPSAGAFRERSTSRTRVSTTSSSASVRGEHRSSSRRTHTTTTSGKSRHANAQASACLEQPDSRHKRSLSTERRTRHSRSRSASVTRMAASPSAAAAGAATATSSLHRRKVHQRPPSTYRTRQELLTRGGGGSNSGSGGIARTNSMGAASTESSSHHPPFSLSRCRSASESDAKSATSWGEWNFGNGAVDLTSHGSGGSGPLLSPRGQKKPGGLMEKLFGDTVSPTAQTNPHGHPSQHSRRGHRLADTFAAGGATDIRPRILLAATVYHNTATSLWIATINTNQRGVAKNPATANKFLKAFSFPTEREARESAIAHAPPKMIPFGESPACFGCQGKFAVFRRAAHCRNCGVCVCNSCSTTWPMNMLPSTYNLKNEANLKVCRSCHSLHVLFKKTLLHGDLEEAIALYETGNINLRSPFTVSNKKDEIMYPIHCAAEGGNLYLLRWLLEDHFCPILIHRSSGRGVSKRGDGSPNTDTSILTSKGRSVLSIAMENLKVDMMRYLVVERSVSVYECKDTKSALAALEATLTSLPYALTPCASRKRSIPSETRWDRACFDDTSETSSLGVEGTEQVHEAYQHANTDCESAGRRSRTTSASCASANGTVGGECIICFDRKINCVATPCGHQVCCLECCNNLTVCPVCNGKATFIKIFRP